ERIGITLNPYHRYVCSAEKQMFEHPRLRAVICNSKMVRDEVQRAFRIGREKLHVIYNGVDLEYFHPRQGEALRGAARAQLGCRPRDTLFLFVGSGFSRKGLAAEIIEPGANGWVCEPDDAPGIARLMQAADGAIRDARMAREARSTAERFGIEAMAGKLSELYASIDERR